MLINLNIATDLDDAGKDLFYYLSKYTEQEVIKKLNKLEAEVDAPTRKKRKILREINDAVTKLLHKVEYAEDSMEQISQLENQVKSLGSEEYMKKKEKKDDKSDAIKEAEKEAS